MSSRLEAIEGAVSHARQAIADVDDLLDRARSAAPFTTALLREAAEEVDDKLGAIRELKLLDPPRGAAALGVRDWYTRRTEELQREAYGLFLQLQQRKREIGLALTRVFYGVASAGDVGAVLRDLRTDAKLTQDAMAARLGVTPGSVRHYESGRRPVPLDVMFRWVSACGFRANVQFRPNEVAEPSRFHDLAASAAQLHEEVLRLVEEIVDLGNDVPVEKLRDAVASIRRYRPMPDPDDD